MKFLILSLAFAAMFAAAFGADCEFKGQSLKIGETYTPIGECIIYTCDGVNAISGLGCPSQATLESCEEVEDLTKPYPKCCPQFKC